MPDTNNTQDIYVRNMNTGITTLVSANSAGTASGNGHSYMPVISADGNVVAFASFANNLQATVPDTGGADIYARNLTTGVTELVSVNFSGTASGNGVSENPTINANGSVIAFSSNANNLQSAVSDTNNRRDVYARNLLTGTTVLVSVNAAGTNSGNGYSSEFEARGPVISADGNVVVFASSATDLQIAVLDNNDAPDIYVRNLATSITKLVSVNTTGTGSGNGRSMHAALSADGNVVAFQSVANNLQSAVSDNNGTSDTYVRNLLTHTTQLVSVSAAGTSSGNNATGSVHDDVQGLDSYYSDYPAISANGEVVAFRSRATNLDGTVTDTNNANDVFIRDLVTGTTRMLSVNAAGTAAGSARSLAPVISGNGDFIAFTSAASNLIDGQVSGFNVYLAHVAPVLTVTVNNATWQKGTPFPEFSVSYDGFRPGDNPSVLGGMLAFDTLADETSVTGTYVVSATGLTSDKYDIEFVPGTLTITQPTLNVTVNDATWEIGTPFPQFTVSYDGFLPGDDPSVLGGSLEISTSANQNSHVGTYLISASGQTSNDYSIMYFDALLTVTPALVAIDIRPTSLNIDQNGAISLVIYGSTSFDVTRVSTSSLVFAGASVNVFQSSLSDADNDGRIDLLIHFRTSDALKEALREMYSDLLLEDDADDGEYSTRQNALIALDGAFGEFGQEFQGTDLTTLFLAGNSLRTLLASLGI
jgi:hypothetical protein